MNKSMTFVKDMMCMCGMRMPVFGKNPGCSPIQSCRGVLL